MKNKKRKGSSGTGVRLILCIGIVCTAITIKHMNPPFVEKIVETVSRDFRIEEAIEAISRTGDIGGEAVEVFSEEANNKEAFDDSFYIDKEKSDALKKELEEAREKAEQEKKELSVETLSFYMDEEELSDDTRAEVFKIPPPSYCSYEKENIPFKFKTPLYGVITSRYGYRDHPIINDASFHTGLDIAAKSGSTITAFADGKVIEAGRNSTYGNYLLIEHSGGIRSFYGHNSKLNVKKGQSVKLGQKIAEVGSTGMSTGPHLHFEVRKNNKRLDPSLYISPETV